MFGEAGLGDAGGDLEQLDQEMGRRELDVALLAEALLFVESGA